MIGPVRKRSSVSCVAGSMSSADGPLWVAALAGRFPAVTARTVAGRAVRRSPTAEGAKLPLMRGGIDLEAPRSRLSSSTTTASCAGSRATSPRSRGGRPTSRPSSSSRDRGGRQGRPEPRDLEAVGVGSPGKVDDDAGTVAGARNLAGWEGSFDLRSTLVDALGTPIVALGNDVGAGTLAEYELGAGKPYRAMLGVFWGTGVGGGIVLDGEMWRGAARRGRSATSSSSRAARVRLRAPGLHGGLRGPRAMEVKAREPGRRRARRPCSSR